MTTKTMMMMRMMMILLKNEKKCNKYKASSSSPYSWDVFIWTNYFMYFIAWLKFRNACVLLLLLGTAVVVVGYDQQKFYILFCVRVCSMFFIMFYYMYEMLNIWMNISFHKTQQKNKIYSLWARSQILIIYSSWDGHRCCMEVKDVENIA